VPPSWRVPPGAARSSDCLPCGCFPFDVFPSAGSHLVPGVTSLRVPLPSQRFARSQGFAPPTGCRPCFMPVPSLGFHPSGFSPTRRAVRAFERPCPLAVSGPAAKLFRFAWLFWPSRFRLRFVTLSGNTRKPGHLSQTYLVETALPRTRPTSGLSSLRVSVPRAGGLSLLRGRDPLGLPPP